MNIVENNLKGGHIDSKS